MPGDAWGQPKEAARMRSAFERIRTLLFFATPSNEISGLSHHNHSQMKHWHPNRDPHAGWKAHCCKSYQASRIAIIHLLNIKIQSVIPTKGGKRIFATNQTKWSNMPRSWSAENTKVNESFGYVQKNCCSSILPAEVLKKTESALPRSMGITKKNASHRPWGSQFWCLQHP